MIVLKPDPKVVNSCEQRSREDGVRRAAADPSRPEAGLGRQRHGQAWTR